MINYVTTANSVAPDTEPYTVLIDVVPVKEVLPPESYLWAYREHFNVSKKRIGDITVLRENGKTIVGLHCAFLNNSGSTIRYKEDDGWKGDSVNDRKSYFKSCMEKLREVFQTERGEVRAFSPLLMTGYYKNTLKRHLSDLEYFITYIEPELLTEYDWTVHYKQVRRFKSNNIKRPQLK